MTTIKKALISLLKDLPDNITLEELIEYIREDWAEISKRDVNVIAKANNDLKKAQIVKFRNFKDNFDKMVEKYSQGVVGLKNNWDEEGSKGYDIELWDRTIKLLKNLLFNLWDNLLDVPIPSILPSPDGSFDLNWETDMFELLVNIPGDNHESVSIYGERIGHKEDEIEVRLRYELAMPVLMQWLRMIHYNGKLNRLKAS